MLDKQGDHDTLVPALLDEWQLGADTIFKTHEMEEAQNLTQRMIFEGIDENIDIHAKALFMSIKNSWRD